MALSPGEVLESKYRVIRTIGEGGMGAVYEGHNVRINRRVAIKVLHQAFTSNPEVVRRFEREAQAAGHIGNDHILEVLDLGTLANGDTYMVMEYLDGEPLSARIHRLGRLTPAQLVPLTKQLLEGLGAAHKAGIIHRDLKPDNVFILHEKAGLKDFVKIIDFGISKFQPLSGDGMKMTRTGSVMGTPYYMSPEQASGSGEADARSDLYAVGVILYEAVTGRVPFDATTFNQLMFKIVLEDVSLPQSFVPELDPAFASLIMKAMARDTGRRFQTAEQFTTALEAWDRAGTGVSIPPTDATALLPVVAQSQAEARAASPAPEPPRPTTSGTQVAFTQSEPAETFGVSAERRRSLPVAAAVTLGALLLGGLGVGLYLALTAAPPTLPASAAIPSEATLPPPPPAAEAPPTAVASAPPEAPPPIDTTTAGADRPPAAPAAAKPAAPTARPAAAAPAPRATGPAATSRPPPPKPAPAVDFGY